MMNDALKAVKPDLSQLEMEQLVLEGTDDASC
jgi:hypothetical protein